jgi:predicted nucleic acid-binding protein
MGQISLLTGSTVYVDSVGLVYTLQSNYTFFDLLEPLWEKFQNSKISIISSELTIPEVLFSAVRSDDKSLLTAYASLLFHSGINLILISREILLMATELRVKHRLKTPDAIHAATSLTAHCQRFLTNDRDFRNITGLPAVILSELLADQ